MAGISNLPDETSFCDSDSDLSVSLEGLEHGASLGVKWFQRNNVELPEGNAICMFLVISLELFEQKLSIQRFGKANVKTFSEKSLIAKNLRDFQ